MQGLQLVSIRLVRESESRYRTRRMTDSRAAFRIFREFLSDLDRESFWIACLDPKQKPVCLSQVSLGTLNSTDAHPREVFKAAILSNASSIIVAHNHPSGERLPSLDDMLVTRRLQQAGEIIGIPLRDHIIVAGRDAFYSFADEGKLE